MSSEWISVRLGDVASFKYGKFLAKSALCQNGFPVFSGYGVVGYLPDYQFEIPQLLIVCRGEGGTGDIKMSPPRSSITNLSIIISPNQKAVRRDFLYWALKASNTRQLRTGSAQAQIVISSLESFPIEVPTSLDEQHAIASVLDSFETRITLLRETNATLEAIAQALFKSWFVDFDPVRARQQGLTPEGMDEATAALFPDGFEESELGRVPKGWEPIRLDSMLELAYGKALKSDARKLGDVPVYGSGGITGWHDAPLVNTPSVVVGRKGTVGSLYWESRPFFPIDTVFYVKTSKPLSYIYYLLQTLGLSEMNTDAAVPGLNRENVYRLKVPGAASKIVTAFDDVVRHLRATIDHNTFKAQTLATLRDTLLPRLIAGQLRLPEAEGILEEIA
ncbi:restriction endonuclease subunit S [Zoogloea sp.]|uniref:restriction endonuclease subunit S n=1 Tax=Zoogloea sp. TaxID=49181 RepID=UPI002BF2DAE4|nr:restriction endonuclease subunit S [Zoogloea sp.]